VSDSDQDITGGRVPLPHVMILFGYKDRRQAARLLDELRVPFITIRRERYYRPRDLRIALDKHTKPLRRSPAAEIGSPRPHGEDVP
jgi:hypothetical protein